MYNEYFKFQTSYASSTTTANLVGPLNGCTAADNQDSTNLFKVPIKNGIVSARYNL